ncbi:aminoacyl-tRNA hydrolase [Candidatus Saccharibacteria bacterium 32-49-12]|nr:MAG: aminoacyl-tRNA hydrolase [Candidatus Saccharibacteria bacterium 32-49-12]
MKIIFAQANPSPDYDQTRHNVGAQAVTSFGREKGLIWKKQARFNALIAEGKRGDQRVLFVIPQTYYNDTGRSARSLCDFYKVNLQTDFLVVHDDLALDFGVIRTRIKGSDAGNNGIKSLNSHLGDKYARIRVGIANDNRPIQQSDADFVLGRFSKSDQQLLDTTILPHINELIDKFIDGHFQADSVTKTSKQS